MDAEFFSKVLAFVSFIILSTGVLTILLGGAFKRHPIPLTYLILLLLVELFAWYMSDYHINRVNIFVLYFSGFIHFSGVILIINRYFSPERNNLRLLLIPIGSVLLFQSFYSYSGSNSFQTYGNVFYNLFILSFSLSYFIRLILKGIKPQRHAILLNSAILLYFSFDSVTSLSANFLINEHLDLVAPFWLIRTVFLHVFYLSLIHFSWQIGKTLKQ